MKKSKTITEYPEVIEAIERLHLLTQASLGFPRGEQSTLQMPDPSVPTAAWNYDAARGGHQIKIGSALPSCLKLLKAGSPSSAVTLRGTMMTYQHERCHALFTGRDFPEISKALTDNKIPFRLWNAFEDLRIEYIGARHLGIKFDWAAAMPPAAPVNGDASDPLSPLAFIIAYKQAIGAAIIRDPKDEANVQNRAHVAVFKKGPWAGQNYTIPKGCTGDYGDAAVLLNANVARFVKPLALIPALVRWLEMFPMPPDRENETIPGESGAVEGINAEAAEGGGSGSGESTGAPSPGAPAPGAGAPSADDLATVRPGTFSEETITSEVATARAMILAEEGDAPADIEKTAPKLDGIEPASGAHYDPTAQNMDLDTTALGFTTHFEAKHKCVPAYGARDGARVPSPYYDPLPPRSTWDEHGEDAAQRLRSAFPGGKGHRFTSNVTGECSIERYINRQPEMFEDRNADNGSHADIILVIDGSSSMRNKWYTYGLSITLGLMKLRNQGAIERLRLVVTGPYDVLMLANPTEDHVAKIEPDAGSEGLWAAYTAIREAGWIEPDRTVVIVLTDGDITDANPDKDRMHAAGVYPVGVYCGPAKSASSRVGRYFDSFIARESRDELLDDIGRLFSR